MFGFGTPELIIFMVVAILYFGRINFPPPNSSL